MRPRKRADWPVVVYQYWVRLEHETWDALPERVRQEAEAMRALWNCLVDAFSERRMLVQSSADSSRTTQFARPFPSNNQLRRYLQESIRQLEADSSVAWANKQFVLTRFQAAVARFYKKQNRLPGRKSGLPEEVHFHHRFTSGGVSVERIFGRGQRVHLEPVPVEAFDPSLPQRQRKRLARTTGSFLVGDILLSFELILHRSLPQGAYLKAATLIGRQSERGDHCRQSGGNAGAAPRWRWSLYCTLEIPPQEESARERTEPIAAMNVDCQFVDEDHLRLAVLTDVGGREEALFLPEDVVRSWRYKRTLQGEADRLTAEAKTQLREVLEMERLPQTARLSLAHLETLLAPGLLRLRESLEKENCTGATRDILRHWGERFMKVSREMRGLERHYLNHRDWFYRNTALRVCQRYRCLVVTAHGGESHTARQLAAPGRFLVYLVEAAKKTRTEVRLPNNSKYVGGLRRSV